MDYGQLKNKMRADAIGEQEAKFFEMTRKGQLAGAGKDAPGSPFGPVSTAPSQTVTGAAQVESFEGSGGYKYGMLPDGAFVILKSGRGFRPGTVVKPGMKGFDAIKREFEDVKAEPENTRALRRAATRRGDAMDRLAADFVSKGMPADEAREMARRGLAGGYGNIGFADAVEVGLAPKSSGARVAALSSKK
jgi:hypothetical protein